MKSNNLLFSVAASALMATFAACSNDLNDVTDSSSSNIRFTSKVIDGVATRGGTDVQTSQLATNLQVGLFADKIENADNALLVADGSGNLNYTASLQWPATGEVNFYAYAPYASDNAGKLSSGEISFAVADDQSSDENYKASDLLYGVPTQNPVSNGATVALAFTHKLSKVIVKLTTKTSTISNPTISLTNVVKDVTLNVATGTVTKGSTTGTVTVGTFSSDAASTDYACAAVIAPQTVSSGTKIIQIEMDGKTYTCSLGADKEFKAGNVYTITVAFDGAAIAVTATHTLTAWATETDSDLELVPTESVVYGVGDYLLADGSFVKKDNIGSETPIGVIFSKNVSATDAADGYNAYVLYIGNTSLGTAKPQGTGSTALTFASDYTVPSNLKAAAEELDGLSHTNYVKNNLVSSSLSEEYPLYDLSALSSEKPNSGTFSDWFIPSIGQAIQILNNLGEANIPESESAWYYCVMPNLSYTVGNTLSMSGKTYQYNNSPSAETLLAKLKEATNGKGIIVSNGRYALSSLLEGNSKAQETAMMDMATGFLSGTTSSIKEDDGSTSHTFTDDEKKNVWGISSGSSTNNARNRIACIAAKLP